MKSLILKNVVLASHLIWNAHKVAPTAQSIHTILSSTPIKSIQEVLDSDDFAGEMAAHGIPWGDMSQLTNKQMLAIVEVANPLSGRPFPARLQAAGITHLEWMEWMKNPIFKRYYSEMTADLLTEHKAELRAALYQEGLKGNIRALEYIDSITDPHDDQSQQLEDMRYLVTKMMEILIEEVSDPVILQRISSKMALLNTGVTTTSKIKAQYQELV